MREILEAIDRKACNEAEERFPLRYRNKGYSYRQFRTPMGKVFVRFGRFIDSWGGRVATPGRNVLEVPAYKRWLPWCLTPAAGLLAKVSYGQSSKETERLQGDAPEQEYDTPAVERSCRKRRFHAVSAETAVSLSDGGWNRRTLSEQSR